MFIYLFIKLDLLSPFSFSFSLISDCISIKSSKKSVYFFVMKLNSFNWSLYNKAFCLSKSPLWLWILWKEFNSPISLSIILHNVSLLIILSISINNLVFVWSCKFSVLWEERKILKYILIINLRFSLCMNIFWFEYINSQISNIFESTLKSISLYWKYLWIYNINFSTIFCKIWGGTKSYFNISSIVDKIISIILVVHFSKGSTNNKEYFSNCSGLSKIFEEDFIEEFISFINCIFASFLFMYLLNFSYANVYNACILWDFSSFVLYFLSLIFSFIF